MRDTDTLKPTKAGTIARTIADDILQGRLLPGTSLDETLIAARYGVSRTPIREAIRQLTANGVLETKPHRGAVVRAFSEKQLDDMFAVMAELEALCARAAALAMSSAEQAALDAMHDEAAAWAARNDRAAFIDYNWRFHEAIYRGAHNDYLAQLTLDTRARLAPFRSVQFEAEGRLERSHMEHGQVLAAIRRSDAALAHAAMRAHLVVVRSTVDEVPDPDHDA